MTTDVVFTLKSPDDAPLVGAQIIARLSRYVVNGGVVLPSEVMDVTDSNGLATMPLHPNTGAAEGSTYTFEIRASDLIRPAYFRRLVVPDQASITFEELIGGSGPVSALTYWDDALIWEDSLIWTEASAPPLTYWVDTETWNDSAIWTE